MEKLREWLDSSIHTAPPQSLTGKAVAYLNRQWPKLIRALLDGRIPLDTNRVENPNYLQLARVHMSIMDKLSRDYDLSATVAYC